MQDEHHEDVRGMANDDPMKLTTFQCGVLRGLGIGKALAG